MHEVTRKQAKLISAGTREYTVWPLQEIRPGTGARQLNHILNKRCVADHDLYDLHMALLSYRTHLHLDDVISELSILWREGSE